MLRKRQTERSRPDPSSELDIQQQDYDPNKQGLLDLPPEIRNLVYQYVAQDSKIMPLRNRNSGSTKDLATDSALSRVNKQIRNEFHGVAWHSAHFSAIVKDLDFRYVVTFLNKLPDAQSIPGVEVPDERSMAVQLVFTKSVLTNFKNLEHWFNRMAHPTKKGTKFQYTYHADLADGVVALGGNSSYAFSNTAIHYWRPKEASMDEDVKRARDTMRQIRRALEVGPHIQTSCGCQNRRS